MPHCFLKHTIDTEPDPELVLQRFKMNIGCSLMYRLLNDLINKTNDRCLLNLFRLFLTILIIAILLTTLCGKLICHLHRLRIAIEAVQCLLHILNCGNTNLNLHTGNDRQVIHRDHIQRI